MTTVGCALDERELAVYQNQPDAGPAPPDSPRECVTSATSCVTSTQRRVCSSDGRWSAPERCPYVCAGDDCGGVCEPGVQRCSSTSEVQRCTDSGEWGTPLACSGSCSGDGCLGECTSGALRCDGAASGSPQRCDQQGVWRDAPRCVPGACAEGSVDQCPGVCTSLASDPLNCGTCGHDCFGGACVAGLCQPLLLGGGFTNPSDVVLSDTHVYFREGVQGSGRIVRMPKAGGELETVVQNVSNLAAVALGGQQLYFASGNAATLGQGQVLRADLDGGNLLPFSPLRAPGISSVIVPGLNVWYTERNALNTLVYRTPLLSQGDTGAGVEAAFETVPGALSSMTVDSGCMFYVSDGAPQQIMRNCTPGASPEVHYTGGIGDVVFQSAASTDGDYLYFAQGNTLARIALDPPAGPEALVSGRVSPPSVDADALYYTSLTGNVAAGVCSTAYALFRASKAPGADAPTQLLAPPLACPTRIASDASALYWVSDDGSVLFKLAK